MLKNPLKQSEEKLPVLSKDTNTQDGNTLENNSGENEQVGQAEQAEPPILLSQGNYEGYEYDLYEGYVSIRGYLGNNEALYIPEEIVGTKVTMIGESGL